MPSIVQELTHSSVEEEEEGDDDDEEEDDSYYDEDGNIETIETPMTGGTILSSSTQNGNTGGTNNIGSTGGTLSMRQGTAKSVLISVIVLLYVV